MDIGWTCERMFVTSTLGKYRDIMFDGRDIWFSYSGQYNTPKFDNTIRIVNFWDAVADYEHLNSLNHFTRNSVAWNTVGTINVSAELQEYGLNRVLDVVKMVKWNGKVYGLLSDQIHIAIFDITSREMTGYLTVAEPVNNLVIAGNKLWACSVLADEITDTQRMYIYTFATSSWTHVPIPGRKQMDTIRLIS